MIEYIFFTILSVLVNLLVFTKFLYYHENDDDYDFEYVPFKMYHLLPFIALSFIPTLNVIILIYVTILLFGGIMMGLLKLKEDDGIIAAIIRFLTREI